MKLQTGNTVSNHLFILRIIIVVEALVYRSTLIYLRLSHQQTQIIKLTSKLYIFMQDSMEEPQPVEQQNKQLERYKKVKILGEGSMGRAYLVQSAEDGKLYVMKRINIGHLSAKQRQNALRQSQLHSLLIHPNVVAFKQVYQTTGQKLCIVMEYAEGGDLDEFIKDQSGKLLPESVILNIFTQICLGLQEVHSKRIIHRDMKTANIFLTKDRQVKIGDFGISRTLDKTQMAATSMIGTPYYLSPEMVEGKPYSTKADIWAVGVLLYQLCSFKFPFQANSLPVLALKILKGSFPPIASQYSKDLKALLLQLLQVDQKKRPSIESILTKPIVSRYVPLQEKNKIISKQQERMQIKREKEKKEQKVEKGDPKDGKEKQRKEKEEKREELRRQMKEDLRKKRGQKQYQSQKTHTNTSLNLPETHCQIKKSPRKDISVTPKIQPAKLKKQEAIKPWKVKKLNEKKDITIEMFVPEQKHKIQSKQESQDFKVQIFVSKKPESLIVETQEEGRKSMPLITQKINNYHYNEDKRDYDRAFENQQIYDDESIEEEDELYELMNDIKNLGEMANKLNPSKDVCLYEQSDNFESTLQVTPQPKPAEIDNLNHIINAETLEEVRFILEQNLGDERFKDAYSICKQHVSFITIKLDNYYQMLKDNQDDRQTLKQKYIFNKNLIQNKMPFLSGKEFEENIELLFTLIMYEEIQTQKNSSNDLSTNQSKYYKLL